MALWPQNEQANTSSEPVAEMAFDDIVVLPLLNRNDFKQTGQPNDADARYNRAIEEIDIHNELEGKFMELRRTNLTDAQKHRLEMEINSVRYRLSFLNRCVLYYEGKIERQERNERRRERLNNGPVVVQQQTLLEVILAIGIGILTFKWLSDD